MEAGEVKRMKDVWCAYAHDSTPSLCGALWEDSHTPALFREGGAKGLPFCSKNKQTISRL